jgi:hypothetical protein
MESYYPENIKDALYDFVLGVQSSSTVPQPLIPSSLRSEVISIETILRGE